MQVGLKTSTGTHLTPSPLSGGGVTRSGAVKKTTQAPVRPQTEFPESPLISTRPIRYNVQLNEQITAVQRADNYLRNTESQLLHLRQAVYGDSGKNSVGQRSENLSQLLEQRTALSGNTVDRQLQVHLEGKTRVGFTLRDAQSILQHQEKEMLMFSLGGAKREITAVQIEAKSSPEQTLLRLNQGLGRWGIHGKLDAQKQISFQVDESQWERISTQLSVRGEGHRYPAEQFFPVKPIAEQAVEERVQDVVAQPRLMKSKMGELDRVLEQITQQRRRLTHNKERVRDRIEGMATYSEFGTAIAASEQLAQKLGDANRDYASLSQALGGQANVNHVTVKNLLG